MLFITVTIEPYDFTLPKLIDLCELTVKRSSLETNLDYEYLFLHSEFSRTLGYENPILAMDMYLESGLQNLIGLIYFCFSHSLSISYTAISKLGCIW